MTLRFPWMASLLLLLSLPACSMRQLAVEQTAAILKDSLPAFEKEWDYELVADALPANIKMVEGFLQSDPQNPDLLLMAAQAYTSYALVVLEDRAERAEDLSDAQTALTQRTREMYLRGHRYGLRLLEGRQPGLRAAFAGPLEQLEQRLAACEADDVPALFWAGMPLASAINLGRDDVSMIALIPKAKALISRALALDEGYYHGGSHMVLGALYGSAGQTLGGDYKKSAAHFGRALELTERKFLLVQVMYAKTLAVQLQDQALYKKLLDEVLAAPLEIFPAQKLANVAAKRRARRLLAASDELF
jgi:predicted anti-sigma-YlaC factor YlaD